jgi:glycosyltransferase involved in cell wall biosynthesis
MHVSLVICTYNRCQSLLEVLDSVARSSLPASVEWELLVVDNNSADQTRAIVEQFGALRCPQLRYLFETKQGLSNARNAGIAAAKGRVVAFTDDDVKVDSKWLDHLTAPLLNGECEGTAGRILLGAFEPPRWLAIKGPHNLGGSLVQFDLGDEALLIDRAPFGASMAFLRRVFDRFGAFRTDLGRSGKSLIGNEDTDLGNRILAGGARLRYVPTAIVYHPVLQERLTKRYFRSYWYSLGRALVRQKGEKLPFLRVPRVYVAEFRRRLRWMKMEDRRWYRKPEGRFYCEMHALQAMGQIVEGWKVAMSPDSAKGSSPSVTGQSGLSKH